MSNIQSKIAIEEVTTYINAAKTPKERSKRKTILFGIMYGMSAESLTNTIK